MMSRLTDRYIGTLKPGEKRYSVSDTEVHGFRLVVLPSGVMTFQYLYRNGEGVRNTYTIGKYGSLTAAEARKIAATVAAKVKSGIDVHAEKKEKLNHAEQKRLQTLSAFFETRYKPYLSAHFKTGDDIARSLWRNFVGPWGDKSLYDIDDALIAAWRNDELHRGLKKGSTNRALAYIKALLARAFEWKVIEFNPLTSTRQLKEDTCGVVRFLDAAEDARLLAALDTRQKLQREERSRFITWKRTRQLPQPLPLDDFFTDYLAPLVILALNTGLRRGELFNLIWRDIDLVRKVVTVNGEGAKSLTTRHVPLNQKAFSAISQWRSQCDVPRTLGTLVFPSPVTGARFDNIQTAWGNLLDLAEIRDFRFHDLRHTFASNLVMRGVDLYTVKDLLGHASIKTTQRYAHLSPSHKTAAVAVLD